MKLSHLLRRKRHLELNIESFVWVFVPQFWKYQLHFFGFWGGCLQRFWRVEKKSIFWVQFLEPGKLPADKWLGTVCWQEKNIPWAKNIPKKVRLWVCISVHAKMWSSSSCIPANMNCLGWQTDHVFQKKYVFFCQQTVHYTQIFWWAPGVSLWYDR